MHFLASTAAMANLPLIGVMVLVVWFAPEPSQRGLFDMLFRSGQDIGQWLATIAYAGIVLVVEPFYVGAGFAMYLNRRVELEAWDVEQEFRLAFAS